MTTRITGVVTSLVTPFKSEGENGTPELDLQCVETLVREQVRAGVSAVAVAGWIGEGPTLSRRERAALIEAARAAAGGRLKVLAHVGSADTARSVAFGLDARAAGADALIVVTPPYNKPKPDGFRTHVQSIADTAGLPILIEHDPERTRAPIAPREIGALLGIEGVAGVIDHSPTGLAAECLAAASRHQTILAASEARAIEALASGADGLFSAVANVSPLCIVGIETAWRVGDLERARRIHAGLLPLIRIVEEEGVAAVKCAMRSKVAVAETVRLPLVPLEEAGARGVATAMALSSRTRVVVEDARLLRFPR